MWGKNAKRTYRSAVGKCQSKKQEATSNPTIAIHEET
jgi:hypothetical protein